MTAPAQSTFTQTALESYECRKAEMTAELGRLRDRSQSLIRYRIGTALPGLLLIVVGVAEPSFGAWTWQLGLLLIALFLVFATLYENLQWKLEKHQSELFGIDRLINRCARDWNQIKSVPADAAVLPFETDWTKDLDIFGERSLFRWASLAMTQNGAQCVASQLTQWASPAQISERQLATQELIPNREWRMRFYQVACGLRNQHSQPEAIAHWVKSPDYFSDKPNLFRATFAGPALVISGITLLLVSLMVPWPTGQLLGLAAALIGFAVNFVISMFAIGPIHDLFNRIGHANRELQQLQDWIELVEPMPNQSMLLKNLKNTLLGEAPVPSSPGNALYGIRRLQRIMAKAGLQKSPVFFILYTLLQICILWDVRILSRLESWKAEYAALVPDWFTALGSLEALHSAAAIADEYPDWTFPEIHPKPSQKTASQSVAYSVLGALEMAHPLLKDEARVPNDISIQDDQRLVLVTGSNMAGKSTLLRSVGVNSILARLGAPVCAKQWSSESFDLASSIRVQDSLQDGVSFFMAELKRLKRVVDQAASESKPDGHRLLVLLDEILQGTNSRERQIAVDSVLRKLVELGCVVLASTHDLELASSDQMNSFAQIVHFREYFETIEGKQIMRFDYRMRPGVTPTTNALKLLELVGL